MLLMGGVINLLLYFNYFRYMKDKMLIISKGCESFWYGDVNNLEQYRKKDIENITIISSYQKGSKGNFWAEFAICKIHFSNNTYPIAFTSLLINKDDLKNKLSKDIQIEEYKTFPFFTDLDVE